MWMASTCWIPVHPDRHAFQHTHSNQHAYAHPHTTEHITDEYSHTDDTPTPSNTPTPTDTRHRWSFTDPNRYSDRYANRYSDLHTFIPPHRRNTPSVSDLIFADGFESGSLSAWTSNANDLGDLSVSAAAALVGSQGMQALIDDNNAIYVNDDSPNAEPRYRARFYFDPNSIPMASGDAHIIFKGFVGTSTEVLKVEFRNPQGLTRSELRIVNDASSFTNTNWFTISDASHFIELDWRAATAVGANNGGLTLWIDDVQQVDLTGGQRHPAG